MEKEVEEILNEILNFELLRTAIKLKFTKRKELEFPDLLLKKSLILLDFLSVKKDEESKRVVLIICSVIWQYRKNEWGGLKDIFILFFSRIGHSPSSVMIDEEFNHETKQFSQFNSYVSSLTVTYLQSLYEIKIRNCKFSLTEFQRNIWHKLDSSNLIGISAPTSAGKSFILALKSLSLVIKKNGSIVYIVPTLSLVSQVSSDFRKLIELFKLDNYQILNTYVSEEETQNTIYVLTQEKAIGAFSRQSKPFQNLRILIVDEIQNIERLESETDTRSKILYDLLQEFKNSNHPDHIIISGPRIENIDNIGKMIFGKNALKEESKNSPVVNFTYSIRSERKNKILNLHCDLLSRPLGIPISENIDLIPKPGGTQYNENTHKFILYILERLGEKSTNIIFSPTTKQARRTALFLADNLDDSINNSLSDLILYIKATVHETYDLCIVLQKGIAYHHAKLPSHVRLVLEKAISLKLISNIICTTTLMQGVNLPAQTIIIRNPNLFIKSRSGETPKLTPYEVANLRGRAGRLMKDLVGRTFVTDENSFIEESDQEQKLFEDEYKEITTGYDQSFEKNRNLVEEQLNYGIEVTLDEPHFLVTYIRQSILKYQRKSLQKLAEVGINLDEKIVKNVLSELLKMEISEEICFANRYWDPFDLNKLYLMRNEFDLPLKHNDRYIAKRLLKIINKFKTEFRIYFDRYIKIQDVPNKENLYSFCINATSWLHQIPLSEILSNSFFDNSEKIDKAIAQLQNDVTYGLPMLLKPIYDILAPNEPFLRYIETGAYLPITRILIEHNVPRETAIYLTNTISNNFQNQEEISFTKIKDEIEKQRDKLPYWLNIQLNF
ncbi:DEAD/DEAH box helicase [Leptospira montravelensis]|uniref:DEAD/DEAH box helicase n=1 Tax=Leptospira montravelensis TaxID=2484961 RepID=A0ABY2LRF6_9LEPT|nr:DEAD/DEAH box helicase [Leptospira montravelensis]TGK77537.1 DEAD/DEAH box helicase [Leptospira montravelensis]TGL02604.1 DEAD/DEAH box helicase [Leptospira montravelensis]